MSSLDGRLWEAILGQNFASVVYVDSGHLSHAVLNVLFMSEVNLRQKSSLNFHTFSSKSSRSRLRKVVAYKRFQI